MANTKTKTAPPALTEAQILLDRFLEGGTLNLPVTTGQFSAMKDACRTPDILMEVVQGERYGGILRTDR